MSNDYLEIPTRLTGQPNSAADYNQGGINERATRLAAIATPGATLFLTSAHNRVQTLNPSANEFVVMPASGIKAGERVEIFNVSPTYTLDPINDASDGDSLGLITPLTRVIFEAKQDNPTEATHWRTVSAGGGWFNGGVVAANFSAGFGTTVTGIASKCMRYGGNLKWSMSFIPDTPAASPATILNPFELLISTGSILASGIKRLGEFNQLFATSVIIYTTTNQAGAYFYDGTNTRVAMTPNTNSNTYEALNGNDFLTAGSVYNMEIEFPVAGWEIG